MSKNCIRICVLLIMMTYSVRSQDVMYAAVVDYGNSPPTNQVRIYSIGPNGGYSGFDTVFEAGSDGSIRQLVYDSAENTMYCLFGADINRIEKYDLEDESPAVVTAIDTSCYNMVIDPSERKIYCGGSSSGIDVLTIDGETIAMAPFMPVEYVAHMVLDGENRYLYILSPSLMTPESDQIQRVSLDNMLPEVIIDVPRFSFTIYSATFTISASKIYWTEYIVQEDRYIIKEADLDGLNVRDVMSQSAFAKLEVYENVIFGVNAYDDTIYRIDIDTGAEMLWSTYDGVNIDIFIKRGAQCTISCLNEGDCVLNEDESEVCKCKLGYTGPTCKRQTAYCCPELVPQD